MYQVVDDLYSLNDILQLIPTQRNRTDEQIDFQQFSTPPTLAYFVNWLANIHEGDYVLEPSAGIGGLAVFAHNSGANLILNELHPRRAMLLQHLLDDTVYTENAEHINDILAPKIKTKPDRIIMNPPFSATAGRVKKHDTRNAIKHVEQALQLLSDNGRLVAILGKGMSEDSPTFSKWWKHLKKKYNVRAVISIDGNNYKKFGTTFGNIIAVIDKNGSTPDNGTFNASVDDVTDFIESNLSIQRIQHETPSGKNNALPDSETIDDKSTEPETINEPAPEPDRKQHDSFSFTSYENDDNNIQRSKNRTVFVESDNDGNIKLHIDSENGPVAAAVTPEGEFYTPENEKVLKSSYSVSHLKNAFYLYAHNHNIYLPDFIGSFSFQKSNDVNPVTLGIIEDNVADTNGKDFQKYAGGRAWKIVNDEGSIVASYSPRLDLLQFPANEFWFKSFYNRDEAAIVHFEKLFRSMLPQLLSDSGYTDDNGRFIPDGNEAFRIHFFYQVVRDKKNVNDFVMPDKPFSDDNDKDNPLSWKDSDVRPEALRTFMSILQQQHALDTSKSKTKKNFHQKNIDALFKKLYELFDAQNENKQEHSRENISITGKKKHDEDNATQNGKDTHEEKRSNDNSDIIDATEEPKTESKSSNDVQTKRVIPKEATLIDGSIDITGYVIQNGPEKGLKIKSSQGLFRVEANNETESFQFFLPSDIDPTFEYDVKNDAFSSLTTWHTGYFIMNEIERVFKEHIHDFYSIEHPRQEKNNEREPVKNQRKIKSSEPQSKSDKPDKTVKRWNALKKIHSNDELKSFLSRLTKEQLIEIAQAEQFGITIPNVPIYRSESKANIVDKIFNEITRRYSVIDDGHDVTADFNGENVILDTPLIRARKDFIANGRPEAPKNEIKRGRKTKAPDDDNNSQSNIVSDTKAGSTSNIKVSAKSDDELKREEAEELNDKNSINVKNNNDDNPDEDSSIFATYRPSIKIEGAKNHPADLVESSAMASVRPPKVTYSPNLPDYIINEGRLSIAQLEAVTYAGQSFTHRTPNDERRGFFIGDGTGVGKGREISGVIMDQLRQGHGKGKAVWISNGHSLIKDAKRDWSGLGNNPNDIFAQEHISDTKLNSHQEGIIFSTYSYMTSKSRVQQLKNWLGDDFDGVIVLDECHRANNSMTISEGSKKYKPSATAMGVSEFIRAFPNARVLYVSATGATDVKNLGMLDRLGLWGKADGFTNKSDFVTSISKGGVAAMEVVARDLKAMGLFIARTLSSRAGPNGGPEDVTFRTLEAKLNEHQKAIYDKFAEMWQKINAHVGIAIELCGGSNGKGLSGPKAKFQAYRQQFFNQVLTTLQTPAAIHDMEKQLDNGNSIVIQLTNTFESAQDKAVVELQKRKQEDDDLDFDDLDISPIQLALSFLDKCFPVYVMEEVEDDEGNITIQVALDSSGKPVINQEALQMRDELIDDVKSIKSFTQSPIDLILDHFGHDNVAEITGRSTRYVLDSNGKRVEQKRNENQIRAEIDDFNDGRKRILIFSGKGDTGASYHASNDYINKQKRIHYLLQAGWRADKAIQGLGRTHRSNEAHKPEYVLVTTDVPRQKRFISTIARRLEQLGALTSGERKASANGLFSAADNLENKYVEYSMIAMLKNLAAGKYPEFDNPDEVFEQLGIDLADYTDGLEGFILKKGKRSSPQKDNGKKITRFLNRVLGLTVDMQKKLWHRFEQEIDWAIDFARKNGTLDLGTENLNVVSFKVNREETVREDSDFGTQTKYVELSVERSIKPRT